MPASSVGGGSSSCGNLPVDGEEDMKKKFLVYRQIVRAKQYFKNIGNINISLLNSFNILSRF